jgi:hypothetical protein
MISSQATKSASMAAKKGGVQATKAGSRVRRDVARVEEIARKLGRAAPDDDPAQVAGAIAIFAADTIRRSANSLIEARAYLDGLRAGIDGLLLNAFPEGKTDPEGKTGRGARRKVPR